YLNQVVIFKAIPTISMAMALCMCTFYVIVFSIKSYNKLLFLKFIRNFIDSIVSFVANFIYIFFCFASYFIFLTFFFHLFIPYCISYSFFDITFCLIKFIFL